MGQVKKNKTKTLNQSNKTKKESAWKAVSKKTRNKSIAIWQELNRKINLIDGFFWDN